MVAAGHLNSSRDAVQSVRRCPPSGTKSPLCNGCGEREFRRSFCAHRSQKPGASLRSVFMVLNLQPFPGMRCSSGANPLGRNNVGARFARRALRGCSASAIACLSFAQPAQAEPDHGLQAGLDVSYHVFRDDVLVPLAFSGVRLAPVPRYFGAVGPGLVVGDAMLGLAYVRDREGAEGVALSWKLHGSYLFPVHAGRWCVTVGPALGWDNELLFISDWDDAHEHWIGTLWLGPGVRAWRWLRGRWRVDLAGDVGLAGFQSRSPAGRRPKQEVSEDLSLPFTDPTRALQFGSILDWQVARASVEFYATKRRAATPNGWGIGSEFALSRASEPALAFAFDASLRASYTWDL